MIRFVAPRSSDIRSGRRGVRRRSARPILDAWGTARDRQPRPEVRGSRGHDFRSRLAARRKQHLGPDSAAPATVRVDFPMIRWPHARITRIR
jgi:hypothetical protein